VPAQLIHVDLNDTNILVAPGVAPAFLDFTPAWRPAAYATAVFAYWIGLARSRPALLDQVAHEPQIAQLLLRVALSKVYLLHEFGPDRAPDTAETAQLATIGEQIVAWVR
jgi:hypothetical protein